MKILILGASGFIGNACFDFFSIKHSVTGIDLNDFHLKGIIEDKDFSITERLITENKFDAIINCAGTSNIQTSFISIKEDFLSNTSYVQKLLCLLKEKSQDSKFINLSSAAVYGNPTSLPINETEKVNPLSPYGFHKLLSEQIVEVYSNLFKLKTLSVRIFSAYGIGLKRQFFYDLYSKFQTNKNAVTLFGSGKESRDFIFISDIMQGLEVLITKGQFEGEIYNLASGKESFIKETATHFAKIVKYDGEIHFSNKQFDGYPLNWKADISKLKQLGFFPKVDMEEGLTKYYKWLVNNF